MYQVQGLKPGAFNLRVKCIQVVQPHHGEGLVEVELLGVPEIRRGVALQVEI
jgi:hypothetical protein